VYVRMYVCIYVCIYVYLKENTRYGTVSSAAGMECRKNGVCMYVYLKENTHYDTVSSAVGMECKKKSVCMYIWRRTLITTRYLQQQGWSVRKKVYTCISEGEHSLRHGIFSSRDGVQEKGVYKYIWRRTLIMTWYLQQQNTRTVREDSLVCHSIYSWANNNICDLDCTYRKCLWQYRPYSANFIQCLHKLCWAYSEVSHRLVCT
jgi:hypothetical protein